MREVSLKRMVLATIIFIFLSAFLSLFLKREFLPGIILGGVIALISLGSSYLLVISLTTGKRRKLLLIIIPLKLFILGGILFLILKRGIIEPIGVIIGILGAPVGSLFAVKLRKRASDGS
ncbi:MAG: hypothetical protein J7L64_03190 [Acidobacteria bacterium]|nr:hypothetical protein [Acidobacteriota bacterium]